MQLLTPEDERDAAFCVGNREFDAQNVGFVAEVGEDGACKDDEYGSTLLDTTKFGNSNKGHSTTRHGVNMGTQDKEALIEFLKTL